MMTGTKVVSSEDLKTTSIKHIKQYDNILKLIRCDKLSERVGYILI
jgi:hypothetical protein